MEEEKHEQCVKEGRRDGKVGKKEEKMELQLRRRTRKKNADT